ncbi:MAG: hypothetical protein HRT58_04995 [Crocinitomicaceae bacterium]|nr:hypothetical protein [Flavobacteriales bacterium]NQZ34996.1 hypothetical protein [Crocinitomicaceae bacterium]
MIKTISLLVILSSSLFGFSQDVTVVGEKIKSITVSVIGDLTLVPHEGKSFMLKYTTILENGDVIRGNDFAYDPQNKNDYVVEIDGAKTAVGRGYSNKGKLKSQWSCKECEEGTKNTLTVRVKREEDSDWLTTLTIKIICNKTAEELETELNARELVFTDAEIEEIQTEFRALSQDQLKKMASGFHKLNEIQKKRVGMGFKGLDQTNQAMITQALNDADRKQPILDLQYWLNAPEVVVTPSKENVYTFKSADTLDFSTGPSKNMAFLKEGNTFIQVKTYSTDIPDQYGFVKQYGFTVNVYDVSTGKFIKKLTKSVEVNLRESSGISINQFKKCPAGYILVNPDMYIVFDKQFNVLVKSSNTSKLKERLYLDVDQLGTSNKYVIFYGDPGGTYSVNQEILDLDLERTFTTPGLGIIDLIIQSSDCIDTPTFSRVFSTSNSEYVFVYFEDGTTRLEKFRFQNNETERVWKNKIKAQLSGIRRVENNTIMYYSDNSRSPSRYFSPDLKAFTINLSGNSAGEVMATIQEKTTGTNFISGDEYEYIYPQTDGSTVVLSKTPYNSKFKRTPIIEVYNPDFTLKGQFRVGMPCAAEAADYGYFIIDHGIVAHSSRGSLSGIDKDPYFDRPEHQVSGRSWRYTNQDLEYRFNTIQSDGITGVKYKSDPDVLTNAVTFFDGHTAFEFIREGDILYMMTPYAIIKLDMNHVVDAVPYKGPTYYTSSKRVFSRSYYFKETD